MRQVFRHDPTATGALLRGPPRIDFHEGDPGTSALDRNISRKLPQATSLIARESRSFLSMFLMLKLSTAIVP